MSVHSLCCDFAAQFYVTVTSVKCVYFGKGSTVQSLWYLVILSVKICGWIFVVGSVLENIQLRFGFRLNFGIFHWRQLALHFVDIHWVL